MLLQLLAHYKYAVLFFGTFFGGDAAMLAGIYLTFVGVMTLWDVVIVTFTASLLSDVVWYALGMVVSYSQLKRLPYFKNNTHHIESLERFLDKHAIKAVFYSKFVYGSRTVIQILCGIHRLDFFEYLFVNITTTVIWILALTGIAHLIHFNLHSFHILAHGIELGFSALVIFAVATHIVLARMLARDDQEGA